MEETRITPVIRQYLQIKERYQEAILFFRLGDFYEMFFEDAEKASRILDITLTSRNRNDEAPVPLCGIPYHAAAPYIGKLLEAGYKVAICEQIEDPKTAKGVVQREVVRVISPGTVVDEEALEARDNNFLAAVAVGRKQYGLAVTDVTTGEFRFSQVGDFSTWMDEIGRVAPAEILVAAGEASLATDLGRRFPGVHLTCVKDSLFSGAMSERLKTMGLWSCPDDPEWEIGILAAGAIVAFLEENAPESLGVLKNLESYSVSEYLILDETTRLNLELLENLKGGRRGSLLEVLDHAATPMGARRLRQWVLYPLLDERAIRERQEGVAELVENYGERQALREAVKPIRDLERLSGKIAAGSAHARDLVAVKEALRAAVPIKKRLKGLGAAIFASLDTGLHELPEVVQLVDRAIVDDPPLALKEGGFIREGFRSELDEIRALRSDAKSWIARLEEKERRRSGISSLKVGYNRVFGYYIEVTKAHLKAVPQDYIRKQTVANGERYITPELKDYESKVLGSEEEILRWEAQLLAEVRSQAASHCVEMREGASALATLDVLLSLAEAAETRHFIRPKIDCGYAIALRDARHPVVEAALGRGAFVPNDCCLEPEAQQVLILTGPNMAGKSTYMRQIALIVILAQMGSFVPAAEARVGLVDRIFTRIGAADSLATGESTFMVEMKEVAHILRHVSSRSLVILDEVGRGTSTFDGISIAWSVAEYLHDFSERPRTLFATHYHELADLTLTKERVRNFHFAVKEWKGEVIFLRRLLEGAASRSYGIHVAHLAGLPSPVVERAKEILKNLEGGELDGAGRPRLASGPAMEGPAQMILFSRLEATLRERLAAIETAILTPVEALNLLHQLVEEAKKESR